ncbi:MAG: DinB family protein [Anaerolineales bacterium]|nr:DinB family protein [Anaerolineales bacterium]
MNIQDIKFIYEYNYWANGKILEAASKVTQEQFLSSAEFPFGSSRGGSLLGTILHIVDAEYGWRGFFEDKKFNEDLNPDDFLTLELLEKKFQEEEKSMRGCLNSLTDEDLNSHITYTNDEGILRDRILWHCMLHVVNHGTQHRSEAAALLTRYNASPGDLDFTLFLIESGNS